MHCLLCKKCTSAEHCKKNEPYLLRFYLNLKKKRRILYYISRAMNCETTKSYAKIKTHLDDFILAG